MPAPLALQVATPASWVDLDLDPSTRRQSIARTVEQAAAHMSPEGRQELARMLERAATDAETQGAVFAAIYSDVIEQRAVSASLVVSVRPGKGMPPQALNRSELAHGLSRTLATTGSVEVRDLPAGPGVRLRKRVMAPLPGQEAEVEVENVQWFVPSPDGSQLALLAFSTPTLGLAEPFGSLFDAIAGTLQWN